MTYVLPVYAYILISQYMAIRAYYQVAYFTLPGKKRWLITICYAFNPLLWPIALKGRIWKDYVEAMYGD